MATEMIGFMDAMDSVTDPEVIGAIRQMAPKLGDAIMAAKDPKRRQFMTSLSYGRPLNTALPFENGDAAVATTASVELEGTPIRDFLMTDLVIMTDGPATTVDDVKIANIPQLASSKGLLPASMFSALATLRNWEFQICPAPNSIVVPCTNNSGDDAAIYGGAAGKYTLGV